MVLNWSDLIQTDINSKIIFSKEFQILNLVRFLINVNCLFYFLCLYYREIVIKHVFSIVKK